MKWMLAEMTKIKTNALMHVISKCLAALRQDEVGGKIMTRFKICEP